MPNIPWTQLQSPEIELPEPSHRPGQAASEPSAAVCLESRPGLARPLRLQALNAPLRLAMSHIGAVAVNLCSDRISLENDSYTAGMQVSVPEAESK
jgi:hypothetical protein